MPNSWSKCRNLTVVLSYHNKERYAQFRKALDVMLNHSEVQELWMVVVLPAGVKKEELPQHKLISYLGPKDISWLGKLTDESIATRMTTKSDMVLWFEMNDKKPLKLLSTLATKTMVAVGVELSTATIQIVPTTDDPSEIVTFVQQTLQKINLYE
ncbi:MAG: hypothetical protein RL632_2351 [Bacteroidota bacterium]